MLAQPVQRVLPIVLLLALTVAPTQAATVTIGQSNPGTIDINRTIDRQALVP